MLILSCLTLEISLFTLFSYTSFVYHLAPVFKRFTLYTYRLCICKYATYYDLGNESRLVQGTCMMFLKVIISCSHHLYLIVLAGLMSMSIYMSKCHAYPVDTICDTHPSTQLVHYSGVAVDPDGTTVVVMVVYTTACLLDIAIKGEQEILPGLGLGKFMIFPTTSQPTTDSLVSQLDTTFYWLIQ